METNKPETAAEQATQIAATSTYIKPIVIHLVSHGESHASIWAKLRFCTDWQPFAALDRHVYSVWTGKGIVFACAMAHASHKAFKIMEHGNNWMTIYIPGIHLSFVWGVGPSKTRPFIIKTRVIWVAGVFIHLEKHFPRFAVRFFFKHIFVFLQTSKFQTPAFRRLA